MQEKPTPSTKRRLSLLLFIFIGAVIGIVRADEASPNFILLLVDDLGYGDLGYTGNPHTPTPNIDKLAAESIEFKNGYAPAPQCSPTRAAIYSGQYPARVRITHWIPGPGEEEMAYHKQYKGIDLPRQRGALPIETVTIAEKLKTADYATAHIGKWHIGEGEFEPVNQGFDQQPGYSPGAAPPSWFSPYGLDTLPDGPDGEYITDRLTTEAILFIKENKRRPFFLSLGYYTVHAPLTGKPENLAKTQAKGFGTDRLSKPHAHFEAMKMSLDQSVGDIMTTLADLGIEENTVVVFTSDNGGVYKHANNLPYSYGKKSFYEGGTRVPLLIRWPKVVPAGSASEEPVNGIDFYPTFLEIAGVTPPANQPIDGVSLLPILKRPQTHLQRETMFWHYPQLARDHGITVPPQGVVLQGNYKLVWPYHPDEEPSLFDIADDPGEKESIASQMPEKVETMKALLKQHLLETDAQMPIPNSLF